MRYGFSHLADKALMRFAKTAGIPGQIFGNSLRASEIFKVRMITTENDIPGTYLPLVHQSMRLAGSMCYPLRMQVSVKKSRQYTSYKSVQRGDLHSNAHTKTIRLHAEREYADESYLLPILDHCISHSGNRYSGSRSR